MLVFDLVVERCPDAQAPDFASQYKKQDTIDAKIKEWEESGWQSDPSNCLISIVRVPNQDDPKQDIELPFTPNLGFDLVGSIVSDEAVVCDDFTEKTCMLANSMLHLINDIETAEKTNDDQKQALKELRHRLAQLYRFKLSYISSNFVFRNCHNIAKTLKWDGLSASVMCQRLGLEEGSTRLTQLAVLADRCGVTDGE